MKNTAAILGSFLLATLAAPVSAQTKLYEVWGPGPWSNFGRSAVVVGDIDADGGDDYWVGSPGAVNELGLVSGIAYLYSGKTGDLRRTSEGKTLYEYYATHLAALGDVDGDGSKDLLIGAPQIEYIPYKSSWTNATGPGFVEIRSGKTATLIRTHAGITFGKAFGVTGSDIGDIDGDQVADYAIGAPRGTSGEVDVYSGASGAFLRAELPGSALLRGWGFFIASFTDVDGDGVDEHLVSSVPDLNLVADYGVTCISGADGSTLWTAISPAGSSSEWGYRALAIDDLNADGVPEVVVGAKRANQYVGFAAWLDGASGVQLAQELGVIKSETMGGSLALCGDLDGDGVAEVAVGSPSEGVPYGFAARGFRIWSGLGGFPKWLVEVDFLHPLSFSTAMAVGDMNGDGVKDMVVGSPNEDIGYIFQGGRIEVITDLLGTP